MIYVKGKIPDLKSIITETGNRIVEVLEPKLQDDGVIKLQVSGVKDVQQEIDSYHPFTDIHYIMQKLKMGDTSVLNTKEPMYGDFTAAPKTYAEAMQLQIDGEKAFKNLPYDIRLKFDNNYNNWIATAGSEEWLSKMNTEKTVEEKQAIKEGDNN